MRKLLLTLAAVSIAALVAVGCGKEDEAASGASELVPAGSVIYGEATLKPEGDQKEAIDTILAKFPGGGQAGDKLKDLIEKGAARVGRADQLQGGHRALARRRGRVLRREPRPDRRDAERRRPDRHRRRGQGARRAREVGRGQAHEDELQGRRVPHGREQGGRRRVRRLPGARHRGGRQGGHRHEQGRQEAVRRRGYNERARRRRRRPARASST